MSESHEHQPEKPQQSQQPDLGFELRELGQQLEQAFRGVIENERTKTLQRDIIAGIRELGHQMQEGLGALKENPRVQHLAERGQQAVNQAQESPVAREFQNALARGIAGLREQIAQFNARVSGTSAQGGSGAQNIAIEHHEEGSATGETTRLDQEKPEQS